MVLCLMKLRILSSNALPQMHADVKICICKEITYSQSNRNVSVHPTPLTTKNTKDTKDTRSFFEGRKGHARSKVPLEGVTEFKDIYPSECPHCGGDEFILDSKKSSCVLRFLRALRG